MIVQATKCTSTSYLQSLCVVPFYSPPSGLLKSFISLSSSNFNWQWTQCSSHLTPISSVPFPMLLLIACKISSSKHSNKMMQCFQALSLYTIKAIWHIMVHKRCWLLMIRGPKWAHLEPSMALCHTIFCHEKSHFAHILMQTTPSWIDGTDKMSSTREISLGVMIRAPKVALSR